MTSCKIEKEKRKILSLRPPRKIKDPTPVEKRKVTRGAIAEANRCLATRTCDSCDVCSLLCPDLCITRDSATGRVVIDYDYCKGCGICAFVCPKGAITMILDE